MQGVPDESAPFDSFKDTMSFQPMFAAIIVMPWHCWIVELDCCGAAKYDLVVKIKLLAAKELGLMASRLSAHKILSFSYGWSMEYTTIKFCQRELNIHKNTRVNFNNYMREVCVASLLKAPCVSHRR